MSAVLPKHQLFESPNSRSIEINDWFLTASTNPISSASECDAMQAELGFSLPEMIFGNNSLTLNHKPSGWNYCFDALHALGTVKKGELGPGDGGVKVGYADAWLKSRYTGPSASLPMPKTVSAKPFDWTYTTTYTGHSTESNSCTLTWTTSDPQDPLQNIPMAELTRPDPILYYAEVPLFEDELHDNGSSALIVRIRVMPGCIFLLSRLTLRVDNVLFRTHDTRLYHSFASNRLIRQVSGWEAPYSSVKQHLPKRDDLTPLTDPGFIAKILADMPSSLSQEEGAKTGWRGLGTKVEYAALGPT
ncbi:TIP41-like family-domain-containing protein [Mycena floridula]|nr:TIP41-like family-domain-containing protein [Mycena floridula]